jgi:hypothetical protein
MGWAARRKMRRLRPFAGRERTAAVDLLQTRQQEISAMYACLKCELDTDIPANVHYFHEYRLTFL